MAKRTRAWSHRGDVSTRSHRSTCASFAGFRTGAARAWIVAGAWVTATAAAACSDSAPEGDPCEGVTCAGRGVCVTDGVLAYCQCEPGFHADGLTCVEDVPEDPCEGVDCEGWGACYAEEGAPRCACLTGFDVDESGLACVGDEYRRCAVDEACLAPGRARAMDLEAGECVEAVLCDELWTCLEGPDSGCDGGALSCSFSPDCAEGVQGCLSGTCSLRSSCEDRIRFNSRDRYTASCGDDENQCPCR